jgi:hypothetical protein
LRDQQRRAAGVDQSRSEALDGDHRSESRVHGFDDLAADAQVAVAELAKACH